MADPALVLRDIHQPVAPPWWPPAPGWWLLAAAIVLAVGTWAWFAARRRQRARTIAAIFDHALAAAETPSAQVAAISELLRRAGRLRDPAADRLHGDAWLMFLDDSAANATRRRGSKRVPKSAAGSHAFAQGPGRLLLDGGFRRKVDPGQVAELRAIARARFLGWMAKQ